MPQSDKETIMISLSPLDAASGSPPVDFLEVEYLLRRAGHESVAAIRADDPRATESHASMARSYSEQSRDLLSRIDHQDGD
jgi:hypothetical protein